MSCIPFDSRCKPELLRLPPEQPVGIRPSEEVREHGIANRAEEYRERHVVVRQPHRRDEIKDTCVVVKENETHG